MQIHLTESWCFLQSASRPLQLCGWREASVSHNNVSTSNRLSKQLTKTSATGGIGSYGGCNATTRTYPGIRVDIYFCLVLWVYCVKNYLVAIVLRCCWICWSLEWILNKLWMHQEFMYTMTNKVSPLPNTNYIVTYSIKRTSITISVCPAAQWLVNLEEGVNQEVAEELRKRGHKVNWPITGTE